MILLPIFSECPYFCDTVFHIKVIVDLSAGSSSVRDESLTTFWMLESRIQNKPKEHTTNLMDNIWPFEAT